MASSSVIPSERIISSIWYQTVAVFSKRNVRCDPTARRRRSFSWIKSGRSTARRRTQCSKPRISDLLIFFIFKTSGSFRRRHPVRETLILVREREHFERVRRMHAGRLLDLNRRERTVGGHHF